MKLIYFTLSFVLSTIVLHAQSLDDILGQLDVAVESKQEYRMDRQNEIDLLKKKFTVAMTDEEKSRYAQLLYQLYSHYKADSAFYYLDAEATCNNIKGNAKALASNRLNKAEIFAIIGAYSEAENHARLACDMAHTDNTLLTRYYHVCRTIYGWEADYMRRVSEISENLQHITQLYRDSIITVESDDISRKIVVADNYVQQGNSYEARKVLKSIDENSIDNEQEFAYFQYIHSEVARLENNTREQLQYLALTALSDIKRGVTEYSALQQLASLLLERGDIVRAYNYLFCAIDDATTCNARLRSVESSDIYPIVEKAYEEHRNSARKRERMLMSGLSLLAILLVCGLMFLRREMRKLSDTRSELADANKQLNEANARLGATNSQLQETNNQLREMDNVKEEYIAIYLGKCRNYIDSLETFRRRLLKLAKNNQHAELMKMLKDDSLMEKDQEQFYADFDNAFLDIHPHFVERFNQLLQPDSQIVPKKGERLTTELRIFALIRLGVKDTTEIARFLNYSMPTIYNYRSRIRNKSILAKEAFDAKVMEL